MSSKKELEMSNYIFEECVPYFQTMRISGEWHRLIFELYFSLSKYFCFFVIFAQPASFLKKPQICYDEGYFKNDDTGYSFKSMFILYLVIIITNLIIFLICKKMIRRNIVERIESTDINHKINTVVTSYLALRDNK